MSSTAIVARLLEQKGEIRSPHGKLSISILIFQDLIAIPMILFLPLLSENAVENQRQLEWSVLKPIFIGISILSIVFFSAQRIVPRLLLQVARTRNKDLFLLSVLTLCFGVAWLTSSLGLSLTIGAFLAGLIISESEYSNEAVSNIFPFQALFISFFFVSIGMLLNTDFFIRHLLIIVGLTTVVVTLKAFAIGLTTLIIGLPLRTAILTGLMLSQVGEFSFVLANAGVTFGLLPEYKYQLFLSVALLSLAISPILINLSPKIANFICSLPLPQKLVSGFGEQHKNHDHSFINHLIIVGFGVSGKNLARSTKLANIPYAILEMNPDIVRDQRDLGEPIYFGDATHLSVLEHFHIQAAKAIAILINDPIAARRIVKIAREANPAIYIIVRTRYMQEMLLMHKLGADDVIPDEFGTSIEVFSRVLKQYYVPDEEIYQLVSDIRAEGYEVLRKASSINLSEMKLNLFNIEMGTFRLHPNSPLVGKLLSESNLRKNHGMTVLLIRREKAVFSNPSPEIQLLANDILLVVGEKEPLKKGSDLFGKLEKKIITESI
jgi:CPA2 family monovalent cation:H+ antiporter-2